MLVDYLTRGVASGLVAGLAFGLLLALVANPLVAVAEDLGHAPGEGTAEHHDTHHETSESLVSTATTRAASVLSGVLWGVLLGGVVFGVAFYLLEPAIPGPDGTESYVLAAAGFLTVSGVPWLVLPPRPPGVEATLPTETRLLLYGGAMVLGAAVCVASGAAYDRLRPRHGRGPAVVAALLPFALLAGPATLAPPTATASVPPALAASVTGLVLFGQVMVWAVLAGVHARLHEGSSDAAATSPSADTEITVSD